MGGFFGCASNENCNKELFYGTDYLSHLGTKRGGIATVNKEKFSRRIHNLENAYFRTKFESDVDTLTGNMGIGVISDTDSQPILIHSHLGKFAVVTVGKIANIDELTKKAFSDNVHFAESSQGDINPSELVAILINQKGSVTEGISNAQAIIKGSCSMLVLTSTCIFAARDRLGRTPIIIGKRHNAFAASLSADSQVDG
ncbi:amidophosphoribosyltransferase [Desulfotignum phosphitoxidans]|uniref:Amidophosphoribosyltransferase PurF n=1 Tax=Desulfotignum phosphitoxidans DSM 13687 TaxID=1286635 RepID=S0G3L5_9BACT|nr:amidophosphoribosyltransferase PurF [Desulfotignum phosphitoxidans]EMS81500.1 amidophosphoribosyltransferase PurF [Desulfotignum phosphitoxidans DSM 13687]